MLRVLAMLVLNVASALQMLCRRTRVNATCATLTDLPQAKIDSQSREANNAAQQSSPTTPSVSPGSCQAVHLLQCCALMEATQRFVATKGNCLHQLKTGGGGLRALARKTEGARRDRNAGELARRINSSNERPERLRRAVIHAATSAFRLHNSSVLSRHAKIRALT
jgi:hypothetical protein